MTQPLPSCLIQNAYLDHSRFGLPEMFQKVTHCGACNEPLTLNTRVYALQCGHSFHPDCLNQKLKDGFSLSLQGKSVEHITCPTPDCNQPIPFNANFIAIASDKHNGECLKRKSICEKVWCKDGMTDSERQMLREFRFISIPNYEQNNDRSILKHIAKLAVFATATVLCIGSFFYSTFIRK